MSELSPKPQVRSDEEQHRLRFEDGSNANQRSAEEQRRLMEEYDQARYEEAFPVDEDAEKSYNEAMEAREYEKNALIEERVLDNPSARRMYAMAQEVAELRANGGEPKIIANKENKLQELLEKYSEEAHTNRDLRLRNAEINERSTVKGAEIRLKEEMEAEEELAHHLEEADFIINSTDEAWVDERVAASEEEIKTPKDADAEKVRTDAEKKFVKDPVEARLLAEVEEISRVIKNNPEEAKKAGLYDRVRELIDEIDAALAAAKKSEEEIKTPKDAEGEEIKTPKDAKTDEEEIKEPKDADLDEEEIKTPKDGDLGDEEIKTPKDAVLVEPGTSEKDDDTKEEERISGWRHPFAYAGALFTVRGADVMERFRSSDKKKVAAVVGAIAIVGGLIAWRAGVFGHGGGNGGNQATDFTPGQKGGHPGPETPLPTPKAPPEIPSGDAYAHPWNWMKAAMENGSVTPPKGMSPEQALHYYGDQLAAAGDHKVEWYSLPNGLEAVRIDGQEGTKEIADILASQFAK
jgi:hypothetical protein